MLQIEGKFNGKCNIGLNEVVGMFAANLKSKSKFNRFYSILEEMIREYPEHIRQYLHNNKQGAFSNYTNSLLSNSMSNVSHIFAVKKKYINPDLSELKVADIPVNAPRMFKKFNEMPKKDPFQILHDPPMINQVPKCFPCHSLNLWSVISPTTKALTNQDCSLKSSNTVLIV